MGSLYRTVWRWHFHAGLAVLPLLAWLAITGALYLYKPEIEGLLYRPWAAASGPAMPIAPMIARVEAETGAQVVSVSRPAAATASWRMAVRGAEGTRRTAFVDPADGRVLGTTREGGAMGVVRSLHSLIITGPVGNALIEIAGGWAILLVMTGVYLWWPRNGSPVVGLRRAGSARLFWRDLHASTGVIAGAVLLFLAVTGMPWSGVWGKGLQTIVAAYGLGRPKPPGSAVAGGHGAHDAHAAMKAALPWALGEAPPPRARGAGDIGPDRAVAIAAARGLAPPWQLVRPAGPGDPYLLASVVTRAEDARAIYVDPAAGTVLADMDHADFGIGARAVEWGIAVHQGQEYGEANRLAMLAGCIAMLLLCVSAPVMWWKRRRAGRLEAPPQAVDPARARGVALIMLAVGALFPLTGMTMVLALAADRLLAGMRGRSPTKA